MRGFAPEAVAKPGKFGYNNLSGVTPAFFCRAHIRTIFFVINS